MHFFKLKIGYNLILIWWLRLLPLCVVCTIAMNYVTHAQQQSWHFFVPPGTESLAKTTINTVIKDKNGFVWFGTFAGLCRYDGNRLLWYTKQKGNNTISNNIVTNIIADRAGNLWIATQAGGLNHYNITTERFTHYPHDPANPSSISNNAVWALYEDRQGLIWCGTMGGGLSSFNPATNRFTRYQHQADNPGSLSGNIVRAVYEDKQGNLWVGTEQNGLNVLPYGSRGSPEANFKRITYSQQNNSPGQLQNVRAITENAEGQLVLSTFNEGIFHLNPTSLKATRLTTDSISLNHTMWIAPGQMGLSTQQGLFLANNDHERGLQTTKIFDKPTNCLFVEDAHNIWVGFEGGGVLKGRLKQPFGIINHKSTTPRILAPRVNGMMQARDGSLWVASWPDGGVSILDLENNTAQQFSGLDPKYEEIISLNPTHFLEDSQGQIWIGSWGDGTTVRATDGTYSKFIYNPKNTNTVPSKIVRTFTEDYTGNLWIGTESGLAMFNRQTKTWVRHLTDVNQHPELDDLRVQPGTLKADSLGYLWFGTWSGGLVRYHPATKKVYCWQKQPNDTTSLSGNAVTIVHWDSQGTLWIGTYGNGLNKVVRTDALGNPLAFKRYSTQQGLPTESMVGLVEDDNQRLWLSTNNGLICFIPATEQCIHFDATHNLQSSEFRLGSAVKLQDGRIAFGGNRGLNIFHPDSIRIQNNASPLYITGFKKFNEQMPFGVFTDSVCLQYHENYFTIEFAALEYYDPAKIRYKYMLEGFDQQWVESGTRNFASYTNLDGGQYTFKVIAANSNGIWNATGAQLNITIVPPFWQTTWFQLLSFVTVILGIMVVIRARVNTYKRRNNKLKAEIEERNRMQQDKELLIQELESKNAELERFNYTVSHDLKSPLVTVRGFIGTIKKDLERGRYDRVAHDMAYIDKAANNMAELLEDLLELSRVGRITYQSEWIDPAVLAQQAATLLQGQLAASGAQLHILPNQPKIWGDKNRLTEVYQNLMENAIKFVPPKQTPVIEVGATDYANEVVCYIKDNGIGVPPKYHEKIFGLFERLDQSVPGTGVGLALLKRIIEVHQGRIWVQSGNNSVQGSIFYFALPKVQTTDNDHIQPTTSHLSA